VSPAGFCTSCGTPRVGAVFCTECGQPFDDVEDFEAEIATLAVPATATAPPFGAETSGEPAAPRRRLRTRRPKPEHAAPDEGFDGEPLGPAPRNPFLADWPRAAAGAGTILAVALVASAIAGTALALAGARDAGVLADAVTTSIALVFPAVGVRVGAFSPTETPLSLLVESPVLPWLLLGASAARSALRRAAPRLGSGRDRDRTVLVALVAKTALLTGALFGGLALLGPRGADRLGITVFVHAWEAAIVPFALVVVAGLLLLAEKGSFPVPADERPGLRRAVRAARAGAGTFGGLLGLMVVAVIVAGVLLPVETTTMPAAGGSLVVVGGTLATLASVFAMGSAVEINGVDLAYGQFDLPPSATSPAAPRLLLLLLAVVPLVVLLRSWRALAKARPRDRQASLSVAAVFGTGFVVAGWISLWFARLVLLTGSAGATRARFEASFPLLRAMGLLLLWGMVASLLAGLLRRIPPYRSSSDEAYQTDWRRSDASLSTERS